MQYIKNFMYAVATDSSASGNYKFINGVALISDGRDHETYSEIPIEAAYRMKWALAARGRALKVAIVEVTGDDEKIIQIV
jgi:hypothetical protein